jgi:hypothetical protein
MLHSPVGAARFVAGAGGRVVRRGAALVARCVAGAAGAVVCGWVAGGCVAGREVAAVVGGVVGGVVSGVVGGVLGVVGAALGDEVPTVGLAAGAFGAAVPHPARTTAAIPATTAPAIRL